MFSMTFSDGLAFLFVKSEMKDIETPDFSDKSFLVISRSSSSRTTLLTKIELYKVTVHLG